MRHALLSMMAWLMVGVMPAKAQTAADLNEGLQVTKGAQAEAFVISWWGNRWLHKCW